MTPLFLTDENACSNIFHILYKEGSVRSWSLFGGSVDSFLLKESLPEWILLVCISKYMNDIGCTMSKSQCKANTLAESKVTFFARCV